MLRAIKIFLIGLLLLVLSLIIALIVYSKTHHDTAHKKLVEIFNEELDGKVEFEDFNFSHLRSFPHVHLELIDITIHDSNSGVSKIGDLDVLLNMRKLWNKEIEIEKLIISDAYFVSEIDSLGNKPRIFSGEKKSKSKGSSPLVLHSHDVEILNSQLYLGNKVKGNKLHINVSKGVFNLDVANSAIRISGDAEASLDTLISNHNLLLSNQPATVKDVVFRIDQETGVKELENGYILAHTLKLIPKIKMTPHENGQLVDLHISSEGNFDTFMELVEFHTGFDVEQVNHNAKLAMSYNQHGIVNPFLRPYSEIDFEISDAEFVGGSLPFPVKNFSLKGNLNNGEAHSPETTELVIDTLHAEVSDSYIHGRFKLTNLKDPVVDAHLVSNINLGHLIKDNDNFLISGQIDADLFLDGKISELKKMHLEGKQHARGEINAQNLNILLKNKGYSINLLNGSTVLNNHIFEVTTVVGAFNESLFNLKGVFDNLDEFFTNEQEELIGNISLDFQKLDLNNFKIEKTSDNPDAKNSHFELPKMSMDVNVTGKEIVGDFGTLSNFKLESRINTNDIIINNLAFNYQEGEVVANAGIFFEQNQVDSVVADIKGNFEFLKLEYDSKQSNKDKSPLSLPTFVYADIDVKIKEGDIFSVPIQNMVLKASVHGDELLVPNFSVEAFEGRSNLSGRLHFNENEVLKIVAKSDMSFEEVDLQDFLKDRNRQSNDSSKLALSDLPAKMDIQLNAFSRKVIFKDQSIENFTADIEIVDNMIDIRRLSTTLPFGKLDLALKVDDLGSESINYNGEIEMDIDTVYVDRLLKSEAFGVPNDSTGKNKSPLIRPDKVFASNSHLNLIAKADRIYYQNGSVDDLDLMITYDSDKIDLKRLEFYFAGGYVSTFGHIINNGSKQYPAYINSQVDSIDIQDLFGAFNNFNQSVLNNENSRGNISWDSHLHFNLNESFFPISDKNLWKFEITLHDGEFKKIEPIEKALFFIGHKVKDDLIVTDLELDAYLYKDKILFRDIFINDNIANMDLFGEINLRDSIIDVGAEISLTDLFFRSKKKRVVETRKGEVHLDKDMKVFLKMQGPISEHKLGLSSKRKFRRSRESLAAIIEQAEEALKDRD